MSYFLKTPCGACAKLPKCVDAAIIFGAINTIHTLGAQRGHLGAGTVDIQCANFGAAPTTAAV